MNNENKKDSMGKGKKIAVIFVIVLLVLWLLWQVVLSIIPTVGGSFGYGFPSGKGGRAIRDVEIDVEPQVVYRIDDHRFFTFEKYLSCNGGGFVYYNDTKRGIKKFAGIEGKDKKPQDEVSINQKNDVLSFGGKFVYAASDNVIAYPGRNVSYKYGGSTYFIIYENIRKPSKNSIVGVSSSFYNTSFVSDDAVYVQNGTNKDKYEKYAFLKNTDTYDWVDSSGVKFDSLSQDDRFHCDNNIKPRSVKYLKN